MSIIAAIIFESVPERAAAIEDNPLWAAVLYVDNDMARVFDPGLSAHTVNGLFTSALGHVTSLSFPAMMALNEFTYPDAVFVEVCDG